MSDDKTTSQLISKSLRLHLENPDSKELETLVGGSEEARKFADLSQLIQQSVAGANTPDQECVDTKKPGLTQEVKQRMKDSMRAAIEEKLSLSQAGLLNNAELQTMPHDSGRKGIADDGQNTRQHLSRFSLIRRLGQGGLGNVWLARDEKLNRSVAIKELKAESLQNPTSWERFHREAEITGLLEHPNVVPLYQYGNDQVTGEPFYAMRFVGKRTLADAIEEHQDRVEAGESCSLGLHRLLSVFLDVCQAIAYAHSRGVVHRDLKPENVALDSFGQVIVLDWGLAKIQEDSELGTKMTWLNNVQDSVSLSQTMEGDVIGTPLYMSPEQAAGNLDKIDDKSDVYGLGAILFAILTGVAPHQKFADGDVSDLSSILKQIASSQAPRAVEYHKTISLELEAICMKAMASKPHLRHGSVQELADAVERWMAGQSEKKSGYDALRMEGRELRADLQASVQNLERNVRFGAGLPPIGQLIQASADEDVSIWRERLSSIFSGLLQANPDYESIVYSKVDGETFTELVRVENLGNDSGKIRVVPKSRLRSDKVNDFLTKVIHRKPEDVLTSLVCDPHCEHGVDCDEQVGLLSAVPVYDDATEDVFGVVMINCDIKKLLRRQMNRRMTAGEVIVACDVFNIMMHSKGGRIAEESIGNTVAQESPHMTHAIEALQNQMDYIDQTNSDIYGARLWFTPNVHGIMYLLKRSQ